MNKETGGPAFPATVRGKQEGRNMKPLQRFEGMTLRDYFAAKAMQGAIGSTSDALDFGPEDGAAWAYRVADAMLLERAK